MVPLKTDMMALICNLNTREMETRASLGLAGQTFQLNKFQVQREICVTKWEAGEMGQEVRDLATKA